MTPSRRRLPRSLAVLLAVAAGSIALAAPGTAAQTPPVADAARTHTATPIKHLVVLF